jgi:hypothetical protein
MTPKWQLFYWEKNRFLTPFLTPPDKWGHLRELRSNSQGVPIYQGEEGWETIGRCP